MGVVPAAGDPLRVCRLRGGGHLRRSPVPVASRAAREESLRDVYQKALTGGLPLLVPASGRICAILTEVE
jgi:hypothetical protein